MSALAGLPGPDDEKVATPKETGMTRRVMLFKLGLLFNGLVAAALAAPVVVIFWLPRFEQERLVTNPGFLLVRWNSFPQGRRGSRRFAIRSPVLWMGKRPISPAGFEMWTGTVFRSLPSTAPIWDVPSAGFPSRTCSCARVMAASTTRMVLVPLVPGARTLPV